MFFLTKLVTGISILAGCILYYLDKKRISDPCYKLQMKKKQYNIKLRKRNELKHQIIVFPISNNITDIKNFVIQEVNCTIKIYLHKK